MSQKTVAALLLAIAAALGGPPAVKMVINEDQIVAPAELTAVDTAVIGELVTVESSGSRVAWRLPVDDYQITDGGNAVHVSFRNPGTYEIIAAAVVGRKVEIVSHVITVGGVVPVPDSPAPDNPVPEVSRNLTEDVYNWCVEFQPPRETCKQLSDSFIDAASKAKSLDDLMDRTMKMNRKIDQKGCERVLSLIQQHLINELDGKSLDDHLRAWDEIGTGLLKWSNTQPPSQGN